MGNDNFSEIILGSYDGTRWSWHLKRNISMTPGYLAMIFVGLGLFTLTIGTAFYLLGASLILPFSLFEVVVLLLAYFYNSIHANDYEKLVLSEKHVDIERKIGFKTSHIQFSRTLARIDRDLKKNALITFKHGNQSTLFGQFVHANLRPTLAKEISKRMLTEIQ
jgi:uncharacterized membrane protein